VPGVPKVPGVPIVLGVPRVRYYPALDVVGESDLVLVAVDDFSPTAIEGHDEGFRVFFVDAASRDAARASLSQRFAVTPIDVSDEDWARRSQEGLAPISVGRITVLPNPESRTPNPDIVVVIRPSMGFGTGHHATTRLCLDALQQIDLGGKTALDVGTGSGVLAIAADRLGAASAIGIDLDPDAIQSARENLELNPDVRHVRFDVADLGAAALSPADVVLANLTGALLERSAPTLLATVRSGGALILSGLQSHERDTVVRAFAAAEVVWEREEDSWVGLLLKKS